jgi:hypothetical protein
MSCLLEDANPNLLCIPDRDATLPSFLPKYCASEIIFHLAQTYIGAPCGKFIGLAYQGKDIVFRFIIEYSSLMDFDPYVIGLFLYEDF